MPARPASFKKSGRARRCLNVRRRPVRFSVPRRRAAKREGEGQGKKGGTDNMRRMRCARITNKMRLSDDLETGQLLCIATFPCQRQRSLRAERPKKKRNTCGVALKFHQRRRFWRSCARHSSEHRTRLHYAPDTNPGQAFFVASQHIIIHACMKNSHSCCGAGQAPGLQR